MSIVRAPEAALSLAKETPGRTMRLGAENKISPR
jgi:hypothetical protein